MRRRVLVVALGLALAGGVAAWAITGLVRSPAPSQVPPIDVDPDAGTRDSGRESQPRRERERRERRSERRERRSERRGERERDRTRGVEPPPADDDDDDDDGGDDGGAD
jgi:hypothetical protein